MSEMKRPRPKHNKRKHSPIPGLARNIVAFNAGALKKHSLAECIAAVADRVYSLSYRERRVS